MKYPQPLLKFSLYEKCPNTEFFLVRIFPYSVRMRENKDQQKLRIWSLFTQCVEKIEVIQEVVLPGISKLNDSALDKRQ